MTNSFGNGDIPTVWGSVALSEGVNVGLTGTFTYLGGGNYIIGTQVNFGLGLPLGPVPVNASGGVSNTWAIYDFYK